MDYKNLDRTIDLHAYMVPPQNLDDTYGELTGIDWSTLTLSCGYYTDTRVSGSLSAINTNWIRGSFIRLVMEIPEEGYQKELGTFAVSNDNTEYKNGSWKTDFELISMLHTMSLDLAPTAKTLARGATVNVAFQNECIAAKRAYNVSAANNTRVGNVCILEGGSSRLSRCYALARMADNRLDVDGHGRVTLERYIEPAAKQPVLTLDVLDNDGVIFDGIGRTSNFLSSPSVVVVSYQYTEQDGDKTTQKEILASVSVEATNHGSLTQRGYNVTDYISLSEMSPATYSEAMRRAKKRLASDSLEKVEWSINTKYLPVWEGDVIELVIPDGNAYSGTRKCLVKSIDINGAQLDMTIKLKETASGDEE